MNTNIVPSDVFVVIKTDDPRFNSVNARDLHGALEVGKDFSTWIKGRIDQYGFIEGEDFMIAEPAYEAVAPVASEVLLAKVGEQNSPDMSANGVANETLLPKFGEQNGNNMSGDSDVDAEISTCDVIVSSEGEKYQKDARGGSNRIDYIISVDMAKELAMIEANDIGRRVRRYFIAAEKELVKRMRDEYATAIANKDAEIAKKDARLAGVDTYLVESMVRSKRLRRRIDNLTAIIDDPNHEKAETRKRLIAKGDSEAHAGISSEVDEIIREVIDLRDEFKRYYPLAVKLGNRLKVVEREEAQIACLSSGQRVVASLNAVIEILSKTHHKNRKITLNDRIMPGDIMFDTYD